jgi:hypothetical protein
MLLKRNQKSIEQASCPRCNLLTPAWRGECLHCGLPVEQGNGSRAEPRTGGSSLELGLRQKASQAGGLK